MRTETIIKNIYEYNELSDKAKKKVKKWYLDNKEDYIFNTFMNSCEERLKTDFPNSNLEFEFSYSCENDGFNICGKINFNDLLDNLNKFSDEEIDKFSDEENEILKEYFEYKYEYELQENNDEYMCCIIDRQDLVEYLIKELESNKIDYDKLLIRKFNELSKEILCDLCFELELKGFYSFYAPSNEDLQEYCNNEGYEFLEDGNLYIG